MPVLRRLGSSRPNKSPRIVRYRADPSQIGTTCRGSFCRSRRGSFSGIQSTQIPVGIDTQALAPGSHQGTITVHTANAVPAEWQIPVSVELFPAN